MNTQQQEILSQLGEFGWQVVTSENAPLDWWADEIWLLTSIWSPTDCKIYITFVVDPMWETPRKKSEGVWAVKASLERPTGYQCQATEVEISLGRGWKERLPEFFESLSKFRSAWKLRCQESSNIGN